MRNKSLGLFVVWATLAGVVAVSGESLLEPMGDGDLRLARGNEDPAASFERTDAGTWRLDPIDEARYTANRIRMQWVNRGDLKADQPYELVLELRAALSGEQTDSGQAGFTVMADTHPDAGGKYSRELARPVIVSGDWTTLRLPFTAGRDYAPGELRVVVRPAYFAVPTEWKPLVLRPGSEDVTTDGIAAYPGQKAGAAWRDEADKRIRRHRMADFALRVIDRHGQPVEGAAVSLEMRKHAYLFGTAVNLLRVVDAPLWESPHYDWDRDRVERYLANNRIYREKLGEHFNYLVNENDLKWPQWTGGRLPLRSTWAQEGLEILDQEGFRIKGHTMVWASWARTPGHLRSYAEAPDQLQDRILEHIRDIGLATRPFLDDFDVLNEPLAHRDIIEILGMDRVAEWFKEADAAMPRTRLIVNDFDILGNYGSDRKAAGYRKFIRELLERGAPLDAIGFQSHFWSDRVTPPERLYEIIDSFAGFELPLMVSEFDMNIPDEALQAQYTADFLKTWFSHPSTVSFIMWGFWGGSHWMGDAGAMYREADWEPKPNLKAYRDLVFREWWTSETGATDGSGHFAVRGFQGEYDLIVEKPGHIPQKRRVQLAADGTDMLVILYDRED